MRCKIGVLTYGILYDLARDALATLSDPVLEVTLIHGQMEEQIPKVLVAREQGVQVFVAGGSNAQFIREHVKVPVVSFGFGLSDFIAVFTQGRKIGRRIGVATYNSRHLEVCHCLEEAMDIELEPLVYTGAEDLRRLIQDSSADVVVGASLAQKIAKECAKPFILMYSGAETILQAVHTARQMTESLQQETRRQLQFDTILNFAWGGIVATDSAGNVIACNPSAEQMLGMTRQSCLGQSLREKLPPCKLRNILHDSKPHFSTIDHLYGKEVVFNHVPIIIDGSAEGAVSTFHCLSEIRDIDRKARSQLRQKGFVVRYHFSDMCGNSSALRQCRDRAEKYSGSQLPVYISGETGVGKEVLAQSMHNASPMRDGPFVPINCAALPESLLESELFGYEEGAFTGARKGGKAGLFEMAHTGTLFLDEVDQISPPLQSRLLRVLQEKVVMRLGADRMMGVSVRVISASNTPLEQCVEERRFRPDLFYRLTVLQLRLPSLRERGNDCVELFWRFLEDINPALCGKLQPHAEVLASMLTLYAWPGNIRELINVTERLSILLEGEGVDEGSLKRLLPEAIGRTAFLESLFKKYTVGKDKKQISAAGLRVMSDFYPGNLQELAEDLGISRTTLWRRLGEEAEG